MSIENLRDKEKNWIENDFFSSLHQNLDVPKNAETAVYIFFRFSDYLFSISTRLFSSNFSSSFTLLELFAVENSITAIVASESCWTKISVCPIDIDPFLFSKILFFLKMQASFFPWKCHWKV